MCTELKPGSGIKLPGKREWSERGHWAETSTLGWGEKDKAEQVASGREEETCEGTGTGKPGEGQSRREEGHLRRWRGRSEPVGLG